jgi:murein DD-endopeptidase MepM/ murein hydrolase activator NlpD
MARMRFLLVSSALIALTACTSQLGELDWDLRNGGGGLDTTAGAQASRARPSPDARGVLSYPGYQVALARRGDTVTTLAARVGIDPVELGRHNALIPTDPLREGEILALPRRVSDPAPGTAGSGIASGPIEVTALAGAAIDRAQTGTGQTGTAAAAPVPLPVAPAGPEPLRHQVKRGETAYSIARSYNVSARALADWNGLGPDLALREGQFLLIPTAAAPARPSVDEVVPVPGQGSPTPTPPSAAKPLPDEKPAPAAAAAPGTPASPNLGAERTGATATKLAMPVAGKVIRPFSKGRNDGIDIAAAAGTPVAAAADGTVAAVTKDTGQVPIVVIRHADGLLTVYAGIDKLTVAKGNAVKRGQQIAVVRAADPAFLHFEVRRGVDAVDPMGFLQ